MTIRAPFLTYRDVGLHTEKFLNNFHPSLKLPIPINGIIEMDLNIRVDTIENLYREHNQNAFLTSDRRTIFIDDYQYDNFIEKTNFTLAHEVGHLVMHDSFYEGASFSSLEEHISFLLNLPQDQLFWFETQANWFAAQVLVPYEQLKKCCVELLISMKDVLPNNKPLQDEFWSYASNALAGFFEVNERVVELRIEKENLAEKFRNYYLDN